jgi:hypothetical protein
MERLVSITIDVPESIAQEAKDEAAAGSGTVDDQITDRLRIAWESDPRA